MNTVVHSAQEPDAANTWHKEHPLERRTVRGGITAPSVSLLSRGSLSICAASRVENALDYEKTTKDRDKKTKQRLYLREEVRAEFGEIVGESPALKTALNLVSVVVRIRAC